MPAKDKAPKHSIRTKITLLTACAIVLSMTIATLIGLIAVRNLGNESSEQILSLMCETGQKNLDSYFDGVEQSVEIVADYVKSDLEETDLGDFPEHVGRAREIFANTVANTNGVLTYYYRIDPEATDADKGFWYTDLDGNGFVEHKVTDITLYDTSDTSALVWFTVPKYEGRSIWLPPYITDNLDVRVISYNVPIYKDDLFIGVVGIEIDYSTMADQVNNIKLYENGYAFINDEKGEIVYHPYIDVTTMSEDERPRVPDGLLGGSKSVEYKYEGVKKQAVRLPLENGMFLTVSVPLSEINGNWRTLITVIILVSAVLLVIFIFITMRMSDHITKPLLELTEAAEQVNAGNYDVKIDHDGDDEVGVLSRTVSKLIKHLKGYISDLNSLAYGDALTSVHNKGAFDIFIREMQERIDKKTEIAEFAIAILDCDDLKEINDKYGHEKGDAYLKNSCHLICRVFQFSPVFRIGGDEFAVILRNEDFANREQLIHHFTEKSAEISSFATEPWEQIRAAIGVAVYDPATDSSVEDVIHRADRLMYENKKERKTGRD